MAEGLIDYYYLNYFMVQALQGKYSYLTPDSTFSSYPWKEPERETIQIHVQEEHYSHLKHNAFNYNYKGGDVVCFWSCNRSKHSHGLDDLEPFCTNHKKIKKIIKKTPTTLLLFEHETLF